MLNEDTKQKLTTLIEKQDLKSSIAFCNELLEANNKSSEIYNVLGVLYAQNNNLNLSIEYFKQAININPNESTYHNNISNALKKQGHLSLAIQHLHQALILDPNYSEAYNNLGSLYYTEGRIQEAIPYFEKAIRISINYFEPHYNLANCLIKEDQVHRAISHYQTALKIKPNHSIVKQNLAMSHIAIKQFKEALPYLEEATKNNPNHPEIHAQLAEIYLETGRTSDAIIHFEHALSLSPKQAVWHHNLAILYLREQQKEKALTHFKEALSNDPNNQTAQHMVNALSNNTIQNASAKYVSDLFDQYSGYYNEHLKNKLQYKVPELLRSVICKNCNFTKAINVLDLGCGTGLCGIYFRDLARNLVGMDLSKGMLAQAKQCGAYDFLCQGNILESIPGESVGFFDVIISADVLVYCGELHNVFKLCAKALKSDGFFAFTVEKLESSKDYQLQTTGRFAHSFEYVLGIAKKNGFQLIESQNVVVRKNDNADIIGILYLFKYQESFQKMDFEHESVSFQGHHLNQKD